MRRIARVALLALAVAPLLASCGDAETGPVTLTLVTYDSFPTEGTSLNDALAAFTKESGITVKIVTAGDAGTMVSKAVLTAGKPEGDVMWGVDNTLLSAAVKGKVFAIDPVAVDYGDVCVNYDIRWFEEHGIAPPKTLDDLTHAEYKDLLVVENPTTSSPGLAFLLATIAKYGDDGWRDYWSSLRSNGVKVADSWDTAYYEDFSGAAGSSGDRPLVVSYGSSPPAEVVFADPPVDTAPTGVAAETCFRQTEYAAILRGTQHFDASRKLMDFLLGAEFQKELPLNLFVYPVNPDVELPEVFTKWAVVPEQPFTMGPDRIDTNRQQWQEQWTDTVLR